MSTIEQLRADIDANRTGDKVAASDPAAAPLGTDEEAAGTPLSPAVIELTRSRELVRGAPHKKTYGTVWIFLIIICLIACVIVMGVWYLTSTNYINAST